MEIKLHICNQLNTLLLGFRTVRRIKFVLQAVKSNEQLVDL